MNHLGGAGGEGGATTTTSGGGGTVPGALEDENLVARYFLDDGANSPLVRDAAPNPVDLTLLLDDALQPTFIDHNGHQGLQWNEVSSWGRAWIESVNGTKFYDRLHDSEAATLEVVTTLLQVDDMGSRLLHFGANTTGGRLSLRMETPGALQLYINNNPIGFGSVPMSQRVVVHVVFDATAPSPARIYVDGAPTPVVMVGEGNAINLDDCHFAIGNRQSGSSDGRSPRGRIFYAAVYDAALTPDRVARHAAHLLADDDAPQ